MEVRHIRPIGAEWSKTIVSRTHRLLSGSARSLVFGTGGSSLPEQELRSFAVDTATFELQRIEPLLSAAKVITPAQRHTSLVCFILVCLTVVLWPKIGSLAIVGFVAVGYVANAIFRGWLFWVGAGDPSAGFATAPREPAGKLPVYTVLVPLFREANVLAQLVESLRALDYPGIR